MPHHGLQDLLLALLLLNAPDPQPVPTYYPREALLAVLQGEDLADARELQYWFNGDPESQAFELSFLRERWQKRHKLPPLHDAMRFPCRETITDMIKCNRLHHDWLRVQQGLSNEDDQNEWGIWINENQQIFETLDAADDATATYYFTYTRRNALLRLKDKLGDRNFRLGLLPPSVPLERFRPLR